MSSEARAAKLKEAEEYKEKANKCMEKSFFGRPEPVAASTYFKRAADAYQACQELRMERLYRLESAACNRQAATWASAAGDYTRAAELALEAPDIPTETDRRKEAAKNHKLAASAWTQMNEKAKAAASQVKAATVLLGDCDGDAAVISKDALQGMEEAIEAHVPDVFNHNARYRQTGISAYIDPDSDETVENPSPDTLALASEHIVTRSYAHEPVLQLVYLLASHREFTSALYAAGAATTILERENLATLTISRAYVTETILTLALGDPVQAEQSFLNKHVQKSSYLSSRECKLAEDLFMAVKRRDLDALEEARDPKGSNRAALANLDISMRNTVSWLRVSGVARKPAPGASSSSREAPSAASNAQTKAAAESKNESPASLQDLLGMKTGYEEDVAAGANLDQDVLNSELDGLDFGDDDSGDGSDSDDSDIDLR